MSRWFGSLFSETRTALAPFVVAIGGAGGAYLWLRVSPITAVVLVVILVFVGIVGFLIGDAQLNQDRPRAVAARRWLQATVAAPIGFATMAGVALIVIAIETAEKKSWSEETKQLVSAFAAAFTTYLTTAFIKGADDADEGWVAGIVKDQFKKRLTDRFPEDELAVRDAAFDTTRSWDPAERKARAEEIDAYIDADGVLLPRTGP